MNNINSVVHEYLCSSCGGCYTVCKADAIIYKESSGGYLFPVVDEQKCTDCGICLKICPGTGFYTPKIKSAEDLTGVILKSFVGKSTDKQIFDNAQSGGGVSGVIKYLFRTNQISACIAAGLDESEKPRGSVKIIYNEQEIIETQKSKYNAIPMLKALKQLKATEGSVAFVGLPCHFHGLNNILKLNSSFLSFNIIKIGLICERVLLSSAIDYICYRSGLTGIKSMYYKDKKYYNYPGNTLILNYNGDKKVISSRIRMAVKDFFTPVRCCLCYDKLNMEADIVFGDPHGVKLADRKDGESLIIARTDIGLSILKRAVENGYLTLREINDSECLKGQKVGVKYKEWSGYMNAWREMGHKLPEYSLDFMAESGRKYYKNLTGSLNIDNLSKKRIYKIADKIVFSEKINRFLRKNIVANFFMRVKSKILSIKTLTKL